MPGWGSANAARQNITAAKRERLSSALAVSRSFKEAAGIAGIPIRTAKRLLPPSAR